MLGALFAGFGPMQFLQLGLGAVSAYSQIQQGRIAAGTAEQQAEQMEIDGIANEAKAINNMVLRIENYDNAMATNEAVFGLLGRDDTSIDAFRQAEQKTLMKDLRTLGMQQELDKGQTKLAAMIEVDRGRNAMRAASIGAITSLGNSYYKARQTIA